MADPQLEDGYTPIANEILEHLIKIHLSSNQWQVLLCIIRKTYGFHKKVDYIANFQIVEATGLCKAVVSRSLNILDSIKVIDRKGKFIGFQKDWERWDLLAESSTKVSSLVNNEKLAESSTLGLKLAEQSTTEKLAIQSTELAISSTKVSSPAVAQKIKETIQKKLPIKNIYGEFSNVLLTDEEHQKLITKFGELGTKSKIEKLSTGIASKGYKYKSHYATILNWEMRGDSNGKTFISNQRRPGQLAPASEHFGIEEYAERLRNQSKGM